MDLGIWMGSEILEREDGRVTSVKGMSGAMSSSSDWPLFRLCIIEGIPSFCLGIFAWLFLADSPETAWYLSPSERQLIAVRRRRDQSEATTASANKLHKADVIAAFKDWKIWTFGVQDFCSNTQLFGYSIFLPTIVHAINPEWSVLRVQALTVPCFVWGIISYFILAFVSDAIKQRALFCALGAFVSIIGHIMLIAGKTVAVSYAGCFVIGTGLLVQGIAIAWMPSNYPRYGKRSTAVGMQIMVGNSAGIAAPYVSRRALCRLKMVLGGALTLSVLPDS